MIFSRYHHRIVEVDPTLRDEASGELLQVCITNVLHLKKDREIYIINLKSSEKII